MPKNMVSKNVGEIKNKIYTIRGRQVMLDSDLAEIYGYTTKAFNQQVKRNIEKFEGEDFMFQLTWKEAEYCSRCNFCPLNADSPYFSRSQNVTLNVKRGENIKYPPYAFTEQGVYMLMTVLKGDLAVRQSRALVMAFKAMKDYILDNNFIITKTIENKNDILKLKSDMKNVRSELSEMIKKSDISPLVLNFSEAKETQEFLIVNGEVVKAKDAIISIYNKARKKIIIIDNYVNYKTLRLLLEVKENLEIIIYTSNIGGYLNQNDIDEFRKERLDINIKLTKISNIVHDRFIVLDDNKVYNLGASSKDIGNKLTMIHEVLDEPIKESIIKIVEE